MKSVKVNIQNSNSSNDAQRPLGMPRVYQRRPLRPGRLKCCSLLKGCLVDFIFLMLQTLPLPLRISGPVGARWVRAMNTIRLRTVPTAYSKYVFERPPSAHALVYVQIHHQNTRPTHTEPWWPIMQKVKNAGALQPLAGRPTAEGGGHRILESSSSSTPRLTRRVRLDSTESTTYGAASSIQTGTRRTDTDRITEISTVRAIGAPFNRNRVSACRGTEIK